MTDDQDPDKQTHDLLANTVLEYFKWHTKFESKGSDEAGAKARLALFKIKQLTVERRKQIQEKRKLRRKLRNNKNGRPFQLTIDNYK